MDTPKKWDSLSQALIFSGSGRLAVSLALELLKKPMRGGGRGDGDRCVRRCRGDPKWIQWPLFKWSIQY